MPIETIIISAVTALVTTLLVEYTAKPWLEARKERILAEARALRALRTLLSDAADLLSLYDGLSSKERDEQELGLYVIELRRFRGQLFAFEASILNLRPVEFFALNALRTALRKPEPVQNSAFYNLTIYWGPLDGDIHALYRLLHQWRRAFLRLPFANKHWPRSTPVKLQERLQAMSRSHSAYYTTPEEAERLRLACTAEEQHPAP